MANSLALLVLEFMALVSCTWGLRSVWKVSKSSTLSLVYLQGWFVFGILSEIAGLFSSLLYYLEDERSLSKAHDWLQKHFLFCWMTLVAGYPPLVASFYLAYYPTPWAHLICACGLIPLIAWATNKSALVVFSTNLIIGFIIPCHSLVCLHAKNWYGLGGSTIMILNMMSLSTPTHYSTYFNLSSREGLVLGVAVTSILFALAVDQMYNEPQILKNLIPINF